MDAQRKGPVDIAVTPVMASPKRSLEAYEISKLELGHSVDGGSNRSALSNAASNPTGTKLKRGLKSRHLQMIAYGHHVPTGSGLVRGQGTLADLAGWEGR